MDLHKNDAEKDELVLAKEKFDATQKNEDAAKPPVEEVKDEVCPDSEYGPKTPPQDDPRMLTSPTLE